MDVKSLKIDLIHWLTELQDQSVLKQLHMLKEQQENAELNAVQEKELDSRLKMYQEGETGFSSWDEVKDRIRDRAKEDL
jgi:putative addiction module component (TIGR02574 family)